MFGFVLGTICLVLLIKMARLRRRAYLAGCGAWSWGAHGCHGHAERWHGRRHEGWGGGWGGGPLRWVFQTLDTTPGQEKVIRQAVDEVRSTVEAARGEIDLSRRDLAAAFAAPSFDAERIGMTFARHDAVLDGVRKAIVGSLAKIHDALDERQRARLVDLLEKGPGFGFGFHPYR